MNKAPRILPAVAGVMLALAARAAETEEPRLEESAQPSRWRISAGARFAPGVKTKASSEQIMPNVVSSHEADIWRVHVDRAPLIDLCGRDLRERARHTDQPI